MVSDRIIAELGFIDFGCGSGKSFEFISSIVPGPGLGIDKSQRAVSACEAKGIPAKIGDLLEFEDRNAAGACFAIDVIPEVAGRTEFERACINLLRAARNFVVIQHLFFDDDGRLAAEGSYIESHFAKNICYKPNLADYLALLLKNVEGFNIVGIAAFGLGETKTAILFENNRMANNQAADTTTYRSLRVLIGRKNIARFRAGLKKVGTGDCLFLWENG